MVLKHFWMSPACLHTTWRQPIPFCHAHLPRLPAAHTSVVLNQRTPCVIYSHLSAFKWISYFQRDGTFLAIRNPVGMSGWIEGNFSDPLLDSAVNSVCPAVSLGSKSCVEGIFRLLLHLHHLLLYPIQSRWVHLPHTIGGKMGRWGRGLTDRPHMPRSRKWSYAHVWLLFLLKRLRDRSSFVDFNTVRWLYASNLTIQLLACPGVY